MSFRQFPAKSHSAISESFLQFLQSSYQSVRSLIENDSSRFILQFFQNQFSFFFICRKKCFKSESSCWKSGQCQGSDTGSRSRKRRYFNPCFITHCRKLLSRIRDSWRSRICDQCNILTFLHFTDQNICLINFVVLMITGHRCFYIKMVQQFNTVSGILCCNKIHFFQCSKYPECNILQISYGCCT